MTIYGDALAGLFALTLLGIVFYGPWQETATDIARQFVFERRDEIFDLAKAGKLGFDSPEYRIIRESLNQLIRFAHELTLPRFVFLMCSLSADELNRASDLSKAIAGIEDRETRREVERIVKDARSIMILMLGMKSSMLVVVALAAVIPALIGGLGKIRTLLWRAESRFGERMQAEAEYA
jgi:hypothetical protein